MTCIRVDKGQRMRNTTQFRPAMQETGNFMEDLWRDLRYAIRTMRKSPLFVVFVVLTLALGIGANTTVFTVINTLILNPLPVPDSSGLAAISEGESEEYVEIERALADLVRGSEGLSSEERSFPLAGGLHISAPCHLAGGWRFAADVQRVGDRQLLLDVGPQSRPQGRFFLPEEDSTPGAHAVAVMNYGTWQTALRRRGRHRRQDTAAQ